MKKALVASTTFAAMALAGVAFSASPAQATEQPDLTTVLWEVTSTTDDVFLTPQDYIAQVPGENLGFWDNPTSGLKCGVKYQADSYPTAEVAKLIEDGLLYGGEDNGIAQHWYVWTTPACEVVVPPVEPPVVAPPTDPPVVVPPVEEPPVVVPPVEQPPVVVPPAVEPPVVVPPVAEPTVPEMVTEQVSAKVVPNRLAETGIDMFPPIFLVLLFSIIGGSLMVFGKRKRA